MGLVDDCVCVWSDDSKAALSVANVKVSEAPLISIVDDDPLLLRSLQDTLEQDEHVIGVADGGQAGIDEFCAAQQRGMPFDVVVTDLGMPNIDGRTVAAAIKSLAPAVPVILLTGWGYRLRAEGDVPQHVERVLSKLARYLSTSGAFTARDKFSGASRREKMARTTLLRGTLFSP